MTPERQRWWDSLSAEEKQVRLAIKKFETDIKWRKQYFSGGLFYTSDQQKSYIAMEKHTIKALRKQIAMRPIVFKYPGYKSYECPRCREGAITYLPHCSMCGQKLRWKECVD